MDFNKSNNSFANNGFFVAIFLIFLNIEIYKSKIYSKKYHCGAIMKKIIFLSVFIALAIIISCDEEILDSPELEQDRWIDLPDNPALGDTTKFDVTSKIVGLDGGTIEFTKDFSGGPFGQYCIYAKLLIKPETFPDNDTLTFTLSVDAKNTSVIISPVKDYFGKPLKLTLTYCGLDLSGLNLAEMEFVYGNGIDTFTDVRYHDAVVDTLTGKLEVTNAYIEYIPNPIPNGKYGWVRKAD